MTLNGANFASGAKVVFGSTRAWYVTRISASQLRAIAPAGSTGAKDVTVTNPDGKSATLAKAFTYARPSRNQSTTAAETTDAAANMRTTDTAVAADAVTSDRVTSDAAPAQSGEGEGITLYFAEGAANSFFDTRFTLTNPGSDPANVTLTFTDTDGLTSSHNIVVAPDSSETVASRDVEALVDRSFATRIDADRLIVAERTMSWPPPSAPTSAPTSASSLSSASASARHDSFGATSTGTLWAVAEGKAGGPDQAATFVMIANTSDQDGAANVTLTLDDGSKVSRTVPLRAHSRATVATDGPFAVALGHRFTALVQSIGDTPPQLVVERVTYTAADGRPWASASSSVATKLR